VTDQQVNQLFEAVRWTPSSFNGQPWRYVYALQHSDDRFEDLLSILNPKNQEWAKNVGLLILGIAKTSVDGREGSNKHAQYDLGAANFALTVQATALGLYVHQMGGFDASLARETFQLAPDHEPMVVLAVGHLEDPAEERPRARKPRLHQTAFAQRLSQ
jgi:nitroreductase